MLGENSNGFSHSQVRHINLDKSIESYERAPIVSFLYDLPEIYTEEINKYDPGLLKTYYSFENEREYNPKDSLVEQAISILASIDIWLIQRLIEPVNNQKE